MEVRLVVCVANKLFPSTNQETAAHFISIPNPNKRFSPKFIPDQTFSCQRLHLPAAANYISCCPHSNKYVENYTRWERNADAFFYLIVPIPSNYWKNIVDTATNTDKSTHTFLFSTSTMMCRTYRTFLHAAPLCWVKHDKRAMCGVEWGGAKCAMQDVTAVPFSWTWLLSGRTGAAINPNPPVSIWYWY